MHINIVVADEFQLVRKGVISLISTMRSIERLENTSSFNIVADVSTPNELITVLSGKPVDLLILGYSLETFQNNSPIAALDGYALIKWLARKYPELKIIVISPYRHPQLIRMVLEMGVLGYISLNVSEKILERAIVSVINNEVYIEKGMMKTLFQGGDLNGKPISLKELEVLRLLCKGHNLTSIAGRMNLSIKTVSAHKLRAMSKLDVNSDCQLFCLLAETRLFNLSF
ncbi:response regulator transcription factor [Serratia sp. M24T3]|uniref:LuxR C-terminal-related transcriptional regulator n=1 Tax=Rouxiella sp. WC2420 TaxID=3234145 RepID=A0AB39VSN6_9GAMM|nr:response regulator transcription factor [Serratia sp. M24T3]EIC82695.1 hypothetical protein SPM24T3_20749 [Serratia sp. M24T3]